MIKNQILGHLRLLVDQRFLIFLLSGRLLTLKYVVNTTLKYFVNTTSDGNNQMK